MDVDTGKCIDGPGSGQDTRWSPDGRRVALVDGWAVKVASIDARSVEDVIEGGPTESNWYTGTWIEPVWSPDGRRLAITARALDMTLLLDLESHEYFVIHEHVSEKIWGLTPKPFASAAQLGR
jgi:Tol biopolymer transport system component